MRPPNRRTFVLSTAALAGCALAPEQSTSSDTALRALADDETAAPAVRWRALQRVDARTLTTEGRILRAAIAPGTEAEAALAQFPFGAGGAPYAVTHRNGAYRNANATPAAINAETARLRADAAMGVVAPAFVLDATIPLVEAAAARATGERAAALRSQLAALRDLRRDAAEATGVWRLPNGAAFYTHALALQLGAPIDPHGAHQRARAECAKFQAEADQILRTHGHRRGEFAARLAALLRDPAQHYAESDVGRGAALADMRITLERARALCASAFTNAPPAAEVRALPLSEEAHGTRGRREGGAYIVDLGGGRARWTLPSVVYHETLPGHLLQAQYELAAPALQRRYAGGYSEGWATYAEMLADALGGHDGAHPLSRLGYLHWMLFRMARIVIDTGMHALRWSHTRAIAEMRALQGESIAFVSIEEDVSRIVAQPGVAAAQGLAALHIADARARTRLPLPAFHDAILRRGPMSPAGLDEALRLTR